jgi:hypothetical protein
MWWGAMWRATGLNSRDDPNTATLRPPVVRDQVVEIMIPLPSFEQAIATRAGGRRPVFVVTRTGAGLAAPRTRQPADLAAPLAISTERWHARAAAAASFRSNTCDNGASGFSALHGPIGSRNNAIVINVHL